MSTPNYQHFDFAAPAITQTRQAAIDATRANLTAEQLDRALWGAAGWEATSTLDAQQRLAQTIYTFRDGDTQQRVTFSYYDAGTGDGKIKSALREVSADAGSTWARIGEHGFTYDANGDMNATITWSD
jgi:hypothetical protein